MPEASSFLKIGGKILEKRYISFSWCQGNDFYGVVVEMAEEKMEVIMVVKRVMISCERFRYVV